MEKLAKYNAATVLDLLSGRLAFERTGVRLYDSIIDKIERQADLRYRAIVDQLRHIRYEEKEHEEWLEEQIRALGGTAHETTEMSQLETEEGQGIVNVICDGHQKISHLLHALLAAELADNAGWDMLVKLADESGDKGAKAAFMKRMAEEAKHLIYVREVVTRAAEIEVLGRDQELPRSMPAVAARKLVKPIAAGSALGLAFLGLGALAASALFIARPNLGWRSRRVLRAC